MVAAITEAQARAKLAFYLDAEEKVLSGQTVREGDISLTRADLSQIRAGRREWQQILDGILAAAKRQTPRARFAIWHNE